MAVRTALLWRAFVRVLILLLVIALAAALYLALVPGALGNLILQVPGVAEMPPLGPTPLPPTIDAQPGTPPEGYLALSGESRNSSFSCGFLMELPDKQQVAFSTAHGTTTPPGFEGVLNTPTNHLAAHLTGQIARGQTFWHSEFTRDYVIWEIQETSKYARFLSPDPRGQGQPGEKVWVYGRFDDRGLGSKRWAGVVMSSNETTTWLQLEDSFSPAGFSGCPVVSQYTGKVIGMAVAGVDRHPVIMGLHPVASLVEKADAALKNLSPGKSE